MPADWKKSLQEQFDALAASAAREAQGLPTAAAPAPAPPPAPAGSRCSMCGTPGASHAGLLQCVTSLRTKVAGLENDPGYLPAPVEPALSLDEIVRRAYANWLAKPETWRRAHPWSAPRLPTLTPIGRR